MNPYDAKRAYTESSILTAPPERLVVMLYDGAIRFLGQAAVAMRADNQRVFLDRVQRGEAIIKELNLTLNMRQGGEVSAAAAGDLPVLRPAPDRRDDGARPAQDRRRHPAALRAARGLAADRRQPARRRRTATAAAA